MTNRKETLIKLLTGSLVSLEELPAKILQENIYDETGHVDMDFLFGILDYMTKQTDISLRIQKALSCILGCEDTSIKSAGGNGEGASLLPEDILKSCTWDGEILTLPKVQLNKKSYLKVKDWIMEAGGSWNGTRQGFTFEAGGDRVVRMLLNGERCNLKKEFQYFETPEQIADIVVSKFTSITPKMRILEPSAGRGALIKAVTRRCPDARVDYFELMPENRFYLEKMEQARFIGTDFCKCHDTWRWDIIVANPPFSKNQDIDHVRIMYEHLAPGGELSAIVSNHWKLSDERNCRDFRQWLQDVKAEVQDLDRGEFKESGTDVATSIIYLVK